MRRVLQTGLVFVGLLGFFGSSAQADIAVWQDAHTKVSLSVPDTWRMVHDYTPGHVVTFMAPAENQHALCRMHVDEDRRYLIYHPAYSGSIQRLYFSEAFWTTYLVTRFNDPEIVMLTDNAGLGRGFASHVEVSYVTPNGPRMERRGLMFASHYNGRVYVLECSSEASAFDFWRRPFISVAKSVDFRKEINELPGGNYRHFLADDVIRIHGARTVDVREY